MAVTLSPNLKLRINSNLTSDARYNLTRIDALAAVYLLDNTETVNLRSKVDINLLPHDASTGGSGIGGIINASTASQYLDSFNIYSNITNLGRNLFIEDNATGGNKKLKIIYQSDLNGLVDTVANRQLSIDLDGANRSLVLGANLTLLGFNLTLNTTAASNLTLPITGTLATLAGTETLTNKTIDASSNNILNLMNLNIASNAAIAYSKLNLANSIVNADINTSAGIVYSKLSLGNSIVNNDISAGAAIAYSKLNLTASIVNADIAPGAAIDASKLSLLNSITDAQVASGAAIQGSKIVPNFGNQEILTSDSLSLEGPSFKTSLQAAQSGQANDILLTLPPDSPAGVLSNDGTGVLSWISVGGTGTVTSVGLSLPSIFSVSGSPVTVSGTLTGTLANQSANLVFAGPSSGGAATPTFRSLAAADIPVASLNHNALLNYVANEHIDHTSVSINTAANSGLSGGGTIAASRSLLIDPTNAPLVTAANNDILLIADVSNANALSKVLISDITNLSGGSFAANWTSGTTFNVNHLLGSRDVLVEIYDNVTYETVMVDSVIRTDTNNIDLTASVAPSGAGLRVLVKRI